jgi:hypothetical protein
VNVSDERRQAIYVPLQYESYGRIVPPVSVDCRGDMKTPERGSQKIMADDQTEALLD